MNEITLLGNYILLNSKEERGKFPLSFAYQFLWSPVEIHRSATVRTLMEIISINPDFYTMALSEPHLKSLVDHYKSPNFSFNPQHISSLCFSWIGAHYKHKKKKEEEFNLILSVFGRNKETDIWGIEFSPLSSIIDLPIFINESVEIESFNLGKKTDKKENKIYKFGKNPILLIELLKSFVSEITFCGSEEDKEKELEKIIDVIEKTEGLIEKENEGRYISIEELEGKFKINETFDIDNLTEEDNEDEYLEDLSEDDFNKMMGNDDK